MNFRHFSDESCQLERLPASSQISHNLRGGRVVKQAKREIKIERPRREVVDRDTALKRVKAFPKRQEKLIAAIRGRAHRGAVK